MTIEATKPIQIKENGKKKKKVCAFFLLVPNEKSQLNL